jgi:hypothetical protein
MDPAPLIDRILDDEGITADLDEDEAMALLRALSERVRELAGATEDAAAARREVDLLARRGRQIADKVTAKPAGAERSALLQQLLDDLGRRPD